MQCAHWLCCQTCVPRASLPNHSSLLKLEERKSVTQTIHHHSKQIENGGNLSLPCTLRLGISGSGTTAQATHPKNQHPGPNPKALRPIYSRKTPANTAKPCLCCQLRFRQRGLEWPGARSRATVGEVLRVHVLRMYRQKTCKARGSADHVLPPMMFVVII